MIVALVSLLSLDVGTPDMVYKPAIVTDGKVIPVILLPKKKMIWCLKKIEMKANKHSQLIKQARWLQHKSLRQLFDLFHAANAQILVVGGAVRNELMGVDVVDIDLATPLLPEKVMQLVLKAGFQAVPTGT